jgi:hypothetical protein
MTNELQKPPAGPELGAAPGSAEERGQLLIYFVYHWRRGNLLPYAGHFEEIMEELCQKAETHFTGPVDPMAPMPSPLPNDLSVPPLGRSGTEKPE